MAPGTLGQVRLWVADRDGANARQVGTDEGGDGWPSWSPDGRPLVFQSEAVGVSDLYVVDADGSNLQRFTSDPLLAVTSEINPAWSPDGSVIAYSSNQAGNTDDGSWQVFTMNQTGGEVVRQAPASFTGGQRPVWLRRR